MSVAFINLPCFSFKLIYIYISKLVPAMLNLALYHFNIPLNFTRSIKSVSSCLVLIVEQFSLIVVLKEALKVSITT